MMEVALATTAERLAAIETALAEQGVRVAGVEAGLSEVGRTVGVRWEPETAEVLADPEPAPEPVADLVPDAPVADPA
jgi:hypothetical protein